MKEWKIILENHFKYIKCSTHGETNELVDKDSKERYKVKFASAGVCVSDFDNVSPGALGDKKCFDVLSVCEATTRYIELKSGIHGKDLKKLGDKFYFGHIKAQTIIAPLPVKDYSYEYIVICTKDIFAEPKTEEVLQKRKQNNDKEYFDAWKKNEVILEATNIEIDPFKTGIIPITKHLFTKQPIKLS